MEGELNGVTAISATDAWAIGYGNNIDPLAVHWDGTSWSVIPTPVPGSYHYMYAIDGAASDDVWAVGDYDDSHGHLLPLALHWDGTTWSVADVPEAPLGNNIFYGVDAVATDDVWAVGIRSAGGLNFQPLIDHWDGTAWSIVRVSPPPGTLNQLFGVSGTGPDDAWAVGFYGESGVFPLFEHWDGTAWTQVDGPPLPEQRDELFSVSSLSTADAWAVGKRISGSYSHPLTMHWDGAQWNVIAAPHPGTTSGLDSVSASSGSDLWTVGSYLPPGSAIYPLTLHNKGCR